MPISIVLDAERRFLRVTLTGRWPTISEQMQERANARKIGLLDADRPVLIDLRGVTDDLPQSAEARLAVTAARQSEGWARRRALLVSTDRQCEAAEIFVALAAPALAVFREEAEAIAWLAMVHEHP